MLERLEVTIYPNPDEASLEVAHEIANLIKTREAAGQPTVLGLATGNTPIGIYKELVRMHKEEALSFSRVVTFNLDEYYPMERSSALSYHAFMHKHLFDHIDIKPENIHIPDGMVQIEDVGEYCRQYEKLIDRFGGLDIQILGIGRTGHVGFNEPPSHANSLTRLVKLDPITISDATREFVREELVPRRAITMGIRSISKARRIFLMAWGEKKAEIIQKAVEGPITKEIPATFLQDHADVKVVLDAHAASALTRIKTPWVVSLVEWNAAMAKKAVIWLSQKLDKPILKLTEDDYKLNDLGDLIVSYGNAHDLNVKIFNTMQYTITGWPGGKPNADDTNRPERASPHPKRVILFSPHPDDDVISMGGTFLRLVEQGHDVHVAYQTSGNIAVFDDDARRYAEFARDIMRQQGLEGEELDGLTSVMEELDRKKQAEADSASIRLIKGLIRKGEATSAARYCGLDDAHIHFLNMPFYETGMVAKGAISEKDLDLIKDLLTSIEPNQIFAAGDLRDPHGTHKICLDAILASIAELKVAGANWLEHCNLWLYRGAWQEWPLHQIEMAIPISPSDLMRKRKAIFKHQSQKDTPVFPGSDKREFWQRAEDRNRDTAVQYDALGLTEYEAIEAFVRYRF